MAREPVAAADRLSSAWRTFSRPWPTLLTGLAATVIGLLFSQTPYVPPRILFLGFGLLLAGAAVARRLQTTSWELEDRTESAGLLALAAFVALLAFLAVEPWDSARVFTGALILLALLGSFLVLLPRTLRRVVASILIVLHFGGILTAVTAVPPRNEPAPWLSMMLWTHFYRHYLTFAYLTNAYHFYSPDPGPPTLLWFYIKYDDGTTRWVKLPNRQESPIGLHHQRMLATAESTNNPAGIPLVNKDVIEEWEKKFGRKYEILPGIKHDSWETILMRRRFGEALRYKDEKGGPLYIQLVSDELPIIQYSEPQEIARRLIASYARHIARTSPSDKNPRARVESVRVYRLTHDLITPRELAAGKDPLDPVYFKGFYMGKYDLDGRLLDPKDPFLFWYLPIMPVPEQWPAEGIPLKAHEPVMGRSKLINCVEIHAEQSDEVQKES
jgi:hypothetical protein